MSEWEFTGGWLAMRAVGTVGGWLAMRAVGGWEGGWLAMKAVGGWLAVGAVEWWWGRASRPGSREQGGGYLGGLCM